MKPRSTLIAGVLALSLPTVGLTETIDEFMKRLDLAEVTFSGHIRYDKSSLNDIPFTFYNEEGEPFPVSLDAGRKVRQSVEGQCENGSFMINRKNLCLIEGTGTIEIRGSRLFLSVDTVSELKPPN